MIQKSYQTVKGDQIYKSAVMFRTEQFVTQGLRFVYNQRVLHRNFFTQVITKIYIYIYVLIIFRVEKHMTKFHQRGHETEKMTEGSLLQVKTKGGT